MYIYIIRRDTVEYSQKKVTLKGEEIMINIFIF